MTERIRFHFDPICPWCHQTSRWVRRLDELGAAQASWGLFSLELVNAGTELAERKGHGRSGPALRTAQVLLERVGDAAVGAFYAAHGRRVHEEGAAVDDDAALRGALAEAGLDASWLDAAQSDDDVWDRIVKGQDELVATTRSFGVPTIVLDAGEGPAIFGPVISEVPDDETAVELLRHVAWLARYENFSELKRDRTIDPPLESFRRVRAQEGS